jgi:antitoxin component YwqK of YwqJK toxin-antitoxin module
MIHVEENFMRRCLKLNHGILMGTILALHLMICLGILGCATSPVAPYLVETHEGDRGEGLWEFAYTGGQIWVRCEYRNGKLNGPWERYYPDGPIQEKGEYLDGKPEGKWVWYYPGGKVYLRGEYLEGEKAGTWETYTSNGKLWWKGDFRNGLRHGRWEAWKNGKLHTEGEYRDGRHHGIWTQYDGEGKVRFRGRFSYGIHVGVWYELDGSGTRIRAVDYAEGDPFGENPPLSQQNERLQEVIQDLQDTLDPTFLLTSAGPFVVVSEIPKYITDTYVTYTISWLHGHMMRDFCRTPPKTAAKSIYLFRDKNSYDYYTQEWIGRSMQGVQGLMTQERIMVNTMSGSGTLAHELMHHYVQKDFPQIPGWFEEGLSALYEQSAEIEGRMVGLVNFRLSELEDAIRKGKAMSLHRMTTTDRDTLKSGEIGLYDSQARYLCYYLQERHVLRPFYRLYRDNYEEDPNGHETLKKLLGEDSLKAIDRDWTSFIRSLSAL